MIFLGIDPGLATTGYGLIEKQRQELKLIIYGCVKTAPSLPFAERLKIIYQELNILIKKYGPDKIAIEKIFFARNTKTAMQVGEARGVVTLVAVQNNLPIFEFTPLQVKQAITGYGQATKQQIQKMVKVILHLKEAPKQDDAADALAIAITCSYSQLSAKILEKEKNSF